MYVFNLQLSGLYCLSFKENLSEELDCRKFLCAHPSVKISSSWLSVSYKRQGESLSKSGGRCFPAKAIKPTG